MKILQFTYRNIVILFLLCILFFFTSVKGDGLQGEFLLSSRWRDLMWYHSPLNNPAYIAEVNSMALRVGLSPVLQGAFTLSEIGFTMPIFQKQAAGVSLLMENDGKVQTSRFDETANHLVTNGTTISNTNFFGILSYSIVPWDRLSAGFNVIIYSHWVW